VEDADVVVVGSRLAGCAVAAPVARSGRKVIVIDRMTFPSDQLSTHLLTTTGVSEIAKMGALPRVLATNPTRVSKATFICEGIPCSERLRPADDGTDFGICVPRDLQDICLVEAAREQGADIRESCTFEDLLWENGRVAGIRYKDESGERREVRATLTVGADGRRSNVAARAGAWTPYRMSKNGRGLVFRYMDDPKPGTKDADTFIVWREDRSMAFAFPSAPAGKLLVLFMGHRDEVSAARKDPEGYWQSKLDQHSGMKERVSGVDTESLTKVRSTGDCPAFFRASSGPGWALAGDAGHFKDPVTGQGMRDAMWMGRTLAEGVIPHLDDPAGVDKATRQWEASRDRHCLPAYHTANLDTRIETQSAVMREIFRDAGRNEESDLSDIFTRHRTQQEIVGPRRMVRALTLALARGEQPRGETISRSIRDLRTEVAIRREIRDDVFRQTRTIKGSDHPGVEWPAPPKAPGAAPGAKEGRPEADSMEVSS